MLGTVACTAHRAAVPIVYPSAPMTLREGSPCVRPSALKPRAGQWAPQLLASANLRPDPGASAAWSTKPATMNPRRGDAPGVARSMKRLIALSGYDFASWRDARQASQSTRRTLLDGGSTPSRSAQ
jgi:hypothetical protein